VAWLSADAQTGAQECETALAAFKRAGDLRATATALVNLGACATYSGDPDTARERLEEALATARRLGFQEAIAWALHELAIAERRARRPAQDAAPMLREALIVHRQLGDRWRVASVLEEVAGAVLTRSDPERAVVVLAAAEALREELGTPVPPAEAPDRDAAVAHLVRRVSSTTYPTAWTRGRELELDAVVDLAVAGIDAVIGPEPSQRSTGEPLLTPRELAVLELVVEGHTNREIAGALYISASTAGVHVSNILRKLGAKRRVDAAGIAHKMGLLPKR